MPSHTILNHLRINPAFAKVHITEDAFVPVLLLLLYRNGLAEHLLGEGLLGFCPKRLCGFGAVYMLKANLMLLLVVQYGDGIPVSDTDDFAHELEGRGREG